MNPSVVVVLFGLVNDPLDRERIRVSTYIHNKVGCSKEFFVGRRRICREVEGKKVRRKEIYRLVSKTTETGTPPTCELGTNKRLYDSNKSRSTRVKG